MDLTVSGKTLFVPDGQHYKVLLTSRLMVVKGPDHGREIEITTERALIGRSRACQLVLSDPAVSSRHAEVITCEGCRVLRDLGSLNGILFSGHRIKEMELQPGTRFQVGNTVLRFDPLDRQQRIPFSPGESFGQALGKSFRMREIFAALEKAAPTDVTVLLEGETGTGKELLAAALHNFSLRSRRPFLVLDCAAVSPELVEDQIFGHQRGAFTGAEEPRVGIFEEAAGGTVFLDELGELPCELQPKLLRLIEEKSVRRLGGTSSVPLDVRLVAATNRDLIQEVERGTFREDLFFRLAVLHLKIPPLRERPEDIFPLATRFLAEGNELRRALGLPEVAFAADVEPALVEYPWPGNGRELRNRIEQALSLAEANVISAADILGPAAGGRRLEGRTLERIEPFKQAKARLMLRFEKEYLEELLRAAGGNLSLAARRAGLMRHHLRELCVRHGLRFSAGRKLGRE